MSLAYKISVRMRKRPFHSQHVLSMLRATLKTQENHPPLRSSSGTRNMGKRSHPRAASPVSKKRRGQVHCTGPFSRLSSLVKKDCHSWDNTHLGRSIDSLEAVKNGIIGDLNSNVDLVQNTYLLTQSMKDALLHIITDLQDNLNLPKAARPLVLLYHGMSGIGKSSLSELLEYYLGLYYGFTWYLKFRHDSRPSDTEQTVEDIFAAPITMDGVPDPIDSNVLIIDQVNCSNMKWSVFRNICRFRDTPVIMFTSGHFIPNDIWLDNVFVQVECIHMTVSKEEAVKITQNTEEVVAELLKVSSTYGALLEMSSKSGDLETMKQLVSVDYSSEELLQVLQVVWHRMFEFMVQHTFEEAVQNRGFRLTIKDLRVFEQYMSDKKKDAGDSTYNAFLKQLIPYDTTSEEDNQHDQYFQSFSFKNIGFELAPCEQEVFHQYSRLAAQCGDPEILKYAQSLFQTCTGFLRGSCFELIIFLYCRINRCGLYPGTIESEVTKGIIPCNASSHTSVVEELFCKENCSKGNVHRADYWFSLRNGYPGFDFILVRGQSKHTEKKFVLSNMYLIQVTDSLASNTLHKKSIMAREFNRILNELIIRDCVPTVSHDKVLCHLLVPPEKAMNIPGITIPLELSEEHQTELTNPITNVPAQVVYASRDIITG